MDSEPSELRALLRLAAPIAAAQLGSMAMGVVDTLMAGPLGEEALAGLALGNTIFFSVVVVGSGTLMSLDSHVSQLWGGGRTRDCGAALGQGIWLAVALAVPLTLLMAAIPFVLPRFGYEPALAHAGEAYLRPLLPGVLPLLLFQAYRSALAAVNVTRPVLFGVIAGNLVHIGLNLWFLRGGWGLSPLGVEGLAWSTSLSRIVLLGGAWWGWHRGLRTLNLGSVWTRPDPARLRGLLRTGLPLGGILAAEVACFGSITLLQGVLGRTALAAHQVVLNIASVIFMVPLGIGAAAAVRCGQAIGRGSPAEARRAGWTAVRLGLVYSVLTATTLVLGRALLLGLYRPPAAVLDLAETLILVCAVFQAADATQSIIMGALRGVGDTRWPFLIVMIAYWLLGVPAGAALAFTADLGPVGLWWGLTLGLSLVALAGSARFSWALRLREAAATGAAGRGAT
jgi:MATE family multidrug resistance protein